MSASLTPKLLVALVELHQWGPATAAQIHKRVMARGVRFGLLPLVYPLMRRLEDGGWVRSGETEPVPERGGRPRIIYSLTLKGRAAAEGTIPAAGGTFA